MIDPTLTSGSGKAGQEINNGSRNPKLPSHQSQQRLGHLTGCLGDGDAGVLEGGDFRFGRALASADNRAGVAHAAPWRRGRSGDDP